MLIKIKKIYKKVKSRRKNPKSFVDMRISRLLPSTIFVRLLYYYATGKKLNLREPKTFNEKLQWMKLHYKNPLCTDLADKYKVREYVKKTIGEKYLIPLIGVYGSANEIDFDSLPNQFVLKCNHDSDSIVICRDKNDFDIQKAKEKLDACINRNYYYLGREWQYKKIKPKIICEKYMGNEAETGFIDYKIFCFDGKPKLIQVHYDKLTNRKKNTYDIHWNFINVEMNFPTDPNHCIKKPDKLDEMLDIASKLSNGFPHVRVDLYLSGDSMYFGEMTFSHSGGLSTFSPEEFNYQMGSWLKLP